MSDYHYTCRACGARHPYDHDGTILWNFETYGDCCGHYHHFPEDTRPWAEVAAEILASFEIMEEEHWERMAARENADPDAEDKGPEDGPPHTWRR